jgi:hypothetical protein
VRNRSASPSYFVVTSKKQNASKSQGGSMFGVGRSRRRWEYGTRASDDLGNARITVIRFNLDCSHPDTGGPLRLMTQIRSLLRNRVDFGRAGVWQQY